MLFINPTVESLAENLRKIYIPGQSKRLLLLNRGDAPRNIFLLSGDGIVYSMKELGKPF
jgi:hypothetical protein